MNPAASVFSGKPGKKEAAGANYCSGVTMISTRRFFLPPFNGVIGGDGFCFSPAFGLESDFLLGQFLKVFFDHFGPLFRQLLVIRRRADAVGMAFDLHLRIGEVV